MTFFHGVRGGFGPRAQGVSGGGYWYPEIDQFRPNLQFQPI